MTPLPPNETLGLPAGMSVIELLSVITGSLHILLFSLALGTALVIPALLRWERRLPARPPVGERLMAAYPLLLSLGIASYMLPALFDQTIAGNLSYAAAVRMGYWWLMIPLALAAAYALASVVRHLHDRGLIRLFYLLIAAVLVMKAAVVAVHDTISRSPVMRADIAGAIIIFATMIALAIGTAGVAMGLAAGRQDGAECGVRRGMRIAAAGASALAALWLLEGSSHPGTPLGVSWVIAFMLTLATAGACILGILRPRNSVWPWTSAVALTGAVISMRAERVAAGLRVIIAETAYTPPPLRPQPWMSAAFVAVLAACIAVLVWMCLGMRSRRGPQ